MGEIFAEHDQVRLTRRISTIAGGDLTDREVHELVGGNLALVKDLSVASKRGIVALVNEDHKPQLESIVGETIDYLPVSYLDRARAAAACVARVVTAERRAKGTGVMVTPRLFMTNHHVIENAEQAADFILQFNYQLTASGEPADEVEFQLDPSLFFCTSPVNELDMSLIAVGAPISAGQDLRAFGWTALSSAVDKHAEGDYVTVIQHPSGDFKQIALRENRVIGRGEHNVTLHYATDTMPGSSGSPVYNDEFELVALHHAGEPLNDHTLDSGKPVPQESNEGIRISAIVADLRKRHDTLPPGFREFLAEALNPPAAATPLENLTAPSRLALADGMGATLRPAGSTEFLLPLRISGADGPSLAADIDANSVPSTGRRSHVVGVMPVRAGAGASDLALERNDAPLNDYGNRRGYDEQFLAQPVPVPTIGAALLKKCAKPEAASRRTQDSVVLAYHHFSVVVRADRKMPLFTVVNLDGRRARRINRKTGAVEAAELWFNDPRIAIEDQLVQPLFDDQMPRIFDRGHMVRRLDPAWGSATTAKRAADDTFHFTNCCPQLLRFNQHLWQNIEDYALDNATDEKKRVTVITGPVFTDADPAYRETAVPRAFWKIVVRVHEGALRATGFLADQGPALDAALATQPTEAFGALGDVEVFQESIDQIEAKSGLSFGSLASRDTRKIGLETAQTPLRSLDDASW
jgi:endonuclease G